MTIPKRYVIHVNFRICLINIPVLHYINFCLFFIIVNLLTLK